MPLVYTTTTGPDPNIVELATPSQNVERTLVQNLDSSIVQNLSAVSGANVTDALNTLFLSNQNTPDGVIQWDFSGPLVLDLLPGIHAPGFYQLHAMLFITTAAAAGNANAPFFSWGQPNFGAATLVFGPLALTATGLVFTVSRAIQSGGNVGVTFSITPAGVAGAPRGNIIVCAERISASPP